MARHRLHVLLAAIVVFLLNPAFACVSEPEFQYGETEMRAAVEGTWDATLTFMDGSQKSLTIGLTQATRATAASVLDPSTSRDRAFVRPAAACGGRTFVRSAGACISASKMPLTGTFVSGDEAYRSTAIVGELAILSLTFEDHGSLTIQLGEHTLLTHNLTKDGLTSNVSIRQRTGGAVLGTATLARRD